MIDKNVKVLFVGQRQWVEKWRFDALEKAANEVLRVYMPKFNDSRTVDDCLVGLAAAVAGGVDTLCPHGMVLAENICGPCSEGRPNSRGKVMSELTKRLRDQQPTSKNSATEYNSLWDEAADYIDSLEEELAREKRNHRETCSVLDSQSQRGTE